MIGGMNYVLEPIKRRIRAAFPHSEISVVDNSRDNVGGVIFIRNAPQEMIERIGISMDYVMVPLDDKPATDVLVVPIPVTEPAEVQKNDAVTRE